MPFPEDLIAFAALPMLLPVKANGKRISRSTLYRWATNGRGGVKLNYTQVGGCRYATLADLEEFFRALKAATPTQSSKSLSGDRLRKAELDAKLADSRLRTTYFAKTNKKGQAA